jgi:hypothetical protein
MPAGDRTGPMGMGPMTGRGFGLCTGHGRPGYLSGGFGRGMGRGRGFGRGGGMGWGRGFGWRNAGAYPAYNGPYRAFPSSAEVREDLESYREELKRELQGVEEEIASRAKTK